ncbi:MAG: sulfatase-like hydrolase/transferase [Phycisphaera sp.]|nr:sulfatase-like hydrolase/transferase [Phycisphaera sp.]
MVNQRPNILFIMADQWHHLDFGFRGHPDIRTPNLDRLQAQAMDFTHAYAQNAFCLPSRASILSGQYVHTHRQYGFTGLFDEHTPCLPQTLQHHGYRTFHVGKFHCNPYGDRLGFDQFIPTLPEDMYQATDPQQTYAAWARQRGVGFPNDHVQGDDFRPVRPPQPLELGGNTLKMFGTSAVPLEHSIERYTAERAIEFLQGHNGDQPFYLSMSFDRPHGPWTPSPEDIELYDPDTLTLPGPLTEDELDRMPAHIVKYVRESKLSTRVIGEDGMRLVLALYYALITRIDHEIGRVLEVLDATGRADHTAIVFCADHGDMAGRLGLFDKYSNCVYRDDIIRTPLLLKLPTGEHQPRQVQHNVELIDLFPTLCHLAEIDTADLPLDGQDLLWLSADPNTPWAGTAFSESYGLKTIIKDGWKLIHYVNSEEGELYCLVDDPQERNNRFADPSCRDKRIELLAQLVAFFTPVPSQTRQAYIRTLFDDAAVIERQYLGKLFKWDKGIIEGAGFWQSFRDGYRLTVIPFDKICRLEKKDASNPTDGLVWHYPPSSDRDQMERMLRELVNYLSGKIRPISIMTGGQEAIDRVSFTRGFGFC